jgi:chromate transporter
MDRSTETSRLKEVAGLFLRLGFTAFGGPAAHISMMEDEVVHRRKWIDRQHFLDLVAAVNFIPGPNSTELAIHLGLLRAGFPGLLMAGTCFIAPAVLIILPIGYAYVTYGHLPAAAGPLMGIRAAIVAVIAAAMLRFGKSAIKDFKSAAIFIGTAAAGFFFTGSELILLGLAAVAGLIGRRGLAPPTKASQAGISETNGNKTLPLLLAAPTLSASSKLLTLNLFFLKVGATLFGSGYVLVSYLQNGLVDDLHWLSPAQMADAVAVGQVTPGPLLTTATFIGYVLGHQWSGHGQAVLAAILCTISIFLPSFLFIALLSPLWERLRKSSRARGALDAMHAAVVALILLTLIGLARQTLLSPTAGIIAAGSFATLLLTRLNSTWLILAAALIGFFSL